MLRKFDCVKVPACSRGHELEGYYAFDPVAQKKQLSVTRWGELYTANCPYCHDTRGRLAVSYYYGVYDDQLERANYTLWKCFNEECQHRKTCRDDLYRRLMLDDFNHDTACSSVRPKAPKVVEATTLPQIEIPGSVVPVNELPTTHQCVQYLRDIRHFDLNELVSQWKVGYAVDMPERARGALSIHRIIVPVIVDGVVVGWQARYPADLSDWRQVRKYLTYFPKSQTLYGIDNAKDAEWITVVEGVTDVWRYGTGSVARLGKRLSPQQLKVLIKCAAGRPIVFIPDMNDPEAEVNTHADIRDLAAQCYAGPVAVCALPQGTDPGGLERDYLRELAKQSLQFAIPVSGGNDGNHSQDSTLVNRIANTGKSRPVKPFFAYGVLRRS
jgi:hypothetical protein